MRLDIAYFETTDFTEIEWLRKYHIEPEMLRKEEDGAVFFLYKKTPALYLSLADLYSQHQLNSEWDEINASFLQKRSEENG